MQMPHAWANHLWNCTGAPCNALVHILVDQITVGCQLPSPQLLSLWPTMEASAARALDLVATSRTPVLFHADDPLFLASSWGEMQRTLSIAAAWAPAHNVVFHTSETKSVALLPNDSAASAARLFLPNPDTEGFTALHYKEIHKWLGMPWPVSLNFCSALDTALARAHSVFSSICCMVSARVLPLSHAVVLFESNVDSILNFGRWLYTLSSEAPDKLNASLDSWARALLGADSWRNSSVCRCELGWVFSGFARGVRSVALRRARALSLPVDDFYRSSFDLCTTQDIGWACLSRTLLIDWGVPDWSDLQVPHRSYLTYKRAVDAALRSTSVAKLREGINRHRAQVPYYRVQQTVPLPRASVLRKLLVSDLPWDVLLCVRGWFRLRAGLACLRTLRGRQSMARHQFCIFCGAGVRNATVHCISLCSAWSKLRENFVCTSRLPQPCSSHILCLQVLSCSVSSKAFVDAVRLADAIDAGATQYWQNNTGFYQP